VNSYTAQEVADMFQIKKQQVARLAASGEWPHHRIGKFIRFTDEDIAKINEITQVAPPPIEANPYGRVTRGSRRSKK